MAKIGARSKTILLTVDPKLAAVVTDALAAAPSWLDFAVIAGLRSAEQQHALWLLGRDASGKIVDRSKVVTMLDGFEQPSNHQSGKAIDIVAYVNGAVSFDDKETAIRAAYLIGFAAARGLKLDGGVRWKWDTGHVEIA